ncbi:Hpt domain-containing protein [Vibrio cholerae]|uniref:Hpt domain-containing protein n=1 Tax=Vibrio cholerae TaxID=666 RepID=UPI0000EF93D6|nr:Hpt domain-containing protein [Vibrio cholerae]ELQ6311580.1 Hpt domain-containing protein [Vibrio cholerae]ELQ6314566.1 Hpt domain-containing protein [Vibrio cholerae]ELQ6314681.1 Hpt domain-containing protein [Vibrio cholerae]KNH57607.1 hpt domain-containing protein [Vibrio cholerae 1587]WOQ97228.1 Hpt domain-containing protein [Vibrio cholerae]
MEQSVAFNISTIAKMVGSDLVEPMLVSYQENTQAQLTKLITIVATQSTSELHRLAHSMKSSARFIGSDALSEFCFQLEMKTAADPEWHSDYVRQVEELCQRSRNVLEQIAIYLEQQKVSNR